MVSYICYRIECKVTDKIGIYWLRSIFVFHFCEALFVEKPGLSQNFELFHYYEKLEHTLSKHETFSLKYFRIHRGRHGPRNII